MTAGKGRFTPRLGACSRSCTLKSNGHSVGKCSVAAVAVKRILGADRSVYHWYTLLGAVLDSLVSAPPSPIPPLALSWTGVLVMVMVVVMPLRMTIPTREFQRADFGIPAIACQREDWLLFRPMSPSEVASCEATFLPTPRAPC